MFIVDDAKAADDWAGVEQHIKDIITGHGGAILASEKWDEARLAYPIKGKSRGVYVLVHFESGPDAVAPIVHDSGLSSAILRVLVLVGEDGIETVVYEEIPDERSGPPRDRHERPRPAAAETRPRPAAAAAPDDGPANKDDADSGEVKGEVEDEEKD